MVKLRLSTTDDVKTLYPEKLNKSFYGITADLDGKPAGIAGLYFDRSWIMFARVTDSLRPYKLTIYKASVELMKAVNILNQPVYAIADPSIPRSDHLLMKMGFTHLSGDWYVYNA